MAQEMAKFTFIKRGDEKSSFSAANPYDPTRPSDKKNVPGQGEEGGGEISLKTFATIEKIKDVSVKTVGFVANSIRGSAYLQAQANAFNNGLNNALGLVSTALAAGPAAAAAVAAVQLVGFAYNEYVFQQQKAWSDYDLDEYRSRRGGDAARYNRSR